MVTGSSVVTYLRLLNVPSGSYSISAVTPAVASLENSTVTSSVADRSIIYQSLSLTVSVPETVAPAVIEFAEPSLSFGSDSVTVSDEDCCNAGPPP